MTDTDEPLRRWLSREGAATYLDVAPSTIDRFAAAGRLTRRKVGSLARYDIHEIDALVISGTDASATRDR
jgi:hypothetical protein